MLDAYYSINGVTSDKFEPKNANEIEVLATFDNNSTQPNITTSEITFTQEAAVYINNYIDNGISGGFGIFEMLPFKIQLKQYTDEYNAFDGLIDLANDLYREDQIVKVKIRDKYGLNNLEDKATAISWAYLYSKGIITDSDFTKTGYVINDIPDGIKLAMLSLTAYMIGKELVELIKQTALGLKDAIQETAGGTFGFIGAAIGVALEIILILAYAAAILVYIYNLVEEIIAQIYSDVRYYKGMKLSTMMTRFCDHIGITFQSSIFTGAYKDIVLLPQKNQKGNATKNQTKFDVYGFPEVGFGYGCFEIINFCLDLFRAKLLYKNNILYLEPISNYSFWEQNSQYILPEIEVLHNGYNTAELKANYLVRFETDDLDTNTIENFKGCNYEVITNSKTTPDLKRTSIKGLQDVSLPVARATRKTKLTAVEEVIKALASAVDGISGIFGGGKSYADLVKNRVGMMNLTSDAMGVPKLLITDSSGKITTTNDTLLTAKSLYLAYHISSSFVNGKNQYKMYNNVIIPFGFTDFLKCIDYGWFKTIDGAIGKFDKISYCFNEDYATCDYRIREDYTDNLVEIAIEAQ